ncbi:MAG: (d)CMP kinase [Clostridia bacterium]|nr:(d)CMP kinase [Clostridia bacterium]
MTFQIAIDGPAGSGKSTMAKILSRKLNAIYLDTGAMYRTVGLKAVQSGIDTKDEKALADMMKNIDITIAFENEEQVIYLDGVNVNGNIRTAEISVAASNVAVFPVVRHKMVEMQRKIASCNNVVMDGRDIGTFVLQQANFKFFLTADAEERAKRRCLEMKEKKMDADYKSILEDIKYRDNNDSSRAFAPLKKADDAILIDTTFLNIDQVINKMMEYIDGKQSN